MRLGSVEVALNSTPQTSTGVTPFEAVTARQFRLPSTLVTDMPKEEEIPHAVRSLRKRQQAIYDIVLGNIDKTALASKKYYDFRNTVTSERYPEGSKVLYRKFSLSSQDPKSFDSLFHTTVYEVVKSFGVNYFIRPTDQPDGKLKTVHHNQIKLYVGRSDEQQMQVKTRDKRRKPARLGFDVTNEDENEVQ